VSSGTRLVVVVASRRGAALAERVKAALPQAEVHATARWQTLVPCAQAIELPLSETLPRLFGDPTVGGLIVVLGVGPTVRLLAPWLHNKEHDPAVVCVDDGGRFAVAVLSGHQGGANVLARRVADALGACPVITTASESNGVLSVDLLGADVGWRIEATPAALRYAAAAVINGDPVAVYQDAGDTAWQSADNVPSNLRVLSDLSEVGPVGVLLAISDRVLELPGELACAVVYRPPTLVAGIGCSRGATADDIAAAIDQALAQDELAGASLACLATVDRRLHEPGVVEYARRSGLPLRGFTGESLAAVQGIPNPSPVVQAAVGTPGVCEPAALLASGAAKLLVPKVKTARATAAIARRVGP